MSPAEKKGKRTVTTSTTAETSQPELSRVLRMLNATTEGWRATQQSLHSAKDLARPYHSS